MAQRRVSGHLFEARPARAGESPLPSADGTMTRSGRVVGSAIGVAALLVAGVALVGNALFSRATTYRYRIALEVETPEGVRKASAVRELRYRKAPQITFESRAFTLEERGEAVALDLPQGQTLFVLTDVNPAETVVAGFAGGDRSLPLKAALDAAPLEVPYAYPPLATLRASYIESPTMVRFRDINDPETIELVDPNDLAASFGSGIRLRRLTVAMTDDDVTLGLASRLEWLLPLARAGARLNGSTSVAIQSADLADNIGPERFSTEAAR